jgi:acyl carrier protein
MSDKIRERIRVFIDENFLFRADRSDFADSESLLDGGIMDSTGVLELVAFLETDFGIAMTDAEIIPENLDSIAAIVRYLQTKTATDIAA